MKTILLLAAVTLIFLWSGCADFPTSYSRIESDKVRLLDFIYEPAEAAPGDTVQLTAVFAGEPVTPDQLTWEMSPKMIINNYGVDAAFDTVALPLIPVDTVFSENTSCIAFRFVIPENIITESPIVPDRWYTTLPDYYQKQLPPEVRSLSKKSILTLLDNPFSEDNPNIPSFDKNLIAMFPALLQCFTAPMRIYCTLDHGHTIMSGYSIRYNCRYTGFPQLHVPVNRNPTIDSIGLYTVEKSPLAAFDPDACDYPFTYRTFKNDTCTITFREGYTCFLAIFTGNLDTTVSIDAAMGNGIPLAEYHQTQWYLQFDDTEVENIAPSELFAIESGNCIAQLYPPSNRDNRTCTAWCEVSDAFINEYHRPLGSTLKELRFEFAFEE